MDHKPLHNKKNKRANRLTRRQFLKGSVAVAGSIALAGPVIVPASVLGANAPSNRITIGMVGMGRQAFYSNLKPFLNSSDTQVVAVCDVDAWRLENARKTVEKHYASNQRSGTFKSCSAYKDFRELLGRNDLRHPDPLHAADRPEGSRHRQPPGGIALQQRRVDRYLLRPETAARLQEQLDTDHPG